MSAPLTKTGINMPGFIKNSCSSRTTFMGAVSRDFFVGNLIFTPFIQGRYRTADPAETACYRLDLVLGTKRLLMNAGQLCRRLSSRPIGLNPAQCGPRRPDLFRVTRSQVQCHEQYVADAVRLL